LHSPASNSAQGHNEPSDKAHGKEFGRLKKVAILNATEKWTMPIQNWSQALSQLDIYFEGRLDSVLVI